MRVLIYNNNKKDLKNLSLMIEAFPLNTLIDKASNYSDTMSLYQKNTYDKVFIDVDDDIGKEISKEILKIYPKQELLMMEEDFYCSNEKDCNSCIRNHSKKVIIKPLTQNELCEVINKTFICESKGKSQKEFAIKKIKKTIHKRYPYFEFEINLKQKTIISKPMSMGILVSFTELLEEYNIPFEVENFEKINLK